MNKNKKSRYKIWLSSVKTMSNTYGITLNSAIKIIDGTGIKSIRELLNSVESDEFISYYLCRRKKKLYYRLLFGWGLIIIGIIISIVVML